MLVKRFLTLVGVLDVPPPSPHPALGLGSKGPMWLCPVGASQFLKGFHHHLGPNRDQILTSENPQLQRRPEAQG